MYYHTIAAAHTQSNVCTTTWLDVTGTRTTILSELLLANPLVLDMLGVNTMQLLFSGIHIKARNLTL